MAANIKFDYHKMYCEENTYRFLAKLKVLEQLEKVSGATSSDETKGDDSAKWVVVGAYCVTASSFMAPPEKQPKRSWPNSMLPIGLQEIEIDGSDASAVMWDYHMFPALLMQPVKNGEAIAPPSWWIYDFDTKVDAKRHYSGDNGMPPAPPFGKAIPLSKYFDISFRQWKGRRVKFHKTEDLIAQCNDSVRFRFAPASDFLAYFTSDRSHMINQMQPTRKDGTVNWQSPPPSWQPIMKHPEVETNLACLINMANVIKPGKDNGATAPGVVVKLADVESWCEKELTRQLDNSATVKK